MKYYIFNNIFINFFIYNIDFVSLDTNILFEHFGSHNYIFTNIMCLIKFLSFFGKFLMKKMVSIGYELVKKIISIS